MMNEQEFKQFKIMLEKEELISKNFFDFVTTLSNLLEFFVLMNRWDSFDKFKESNKNVFSFLQKETKISKLNINKRMYQHFFTSGYIFHITKTENQSFILNRGILSLNERFDTDVYSDCCHINRCWRNIVAKNKGKIMKRSLIDIPNKDRLYKKRFSSVYLSTNIIDAMEHYGDGMELFSFFLDDLMDGLKVPEHFKYQDKEILQNQIINKLNTYCVNSLEKQIILDFYNKYYEPVQRKNRIDKSIIMVPIENIINKNMHSEMYQTLVKKPNGFYDYFIHCNDIEYQKKISSNNLLAVEVRQEKEQKIKLKVNRSTNRGV